MLSCIVLLLFFTYVLLQFPRYQHQTNSKMSHWCSARVFSFYKHCILLKIIFYNGSQWEDCKASTLEFSNIIQIQTAFWYLLYLLTFSCFSSMQFSCVTSTSGKRSIMLNPKKLFWTPWSLKTSLFHLETQFKVSTVPPTLVLLALKYLSDWNCYLWAFSIRVWPMPFHVSRVSMESLPVLDTTFCFNDVTASV